MQGEEGGGAADLEGKEALARLLPRVGVARLPGHALDLPEVALPEEVHRRQVRQPNVRPRRVAPAAEGPVEDEVRLAAGPRRPAAAAPFPGVLLPAVRWPLAL